MKFILLSVFLMTSLSKTLATNISAEDLIEWESFKGKFVKSYASDQEEETRKLVFMENLKFIREHNRKFENQEETFTTGINQFSDMTHEEFRKQMNGFKPELKTKSATVFKKPENLSVPDSVDWRDKGAVTAVKNQGSCGSCWAFSTTGSIEGQHFISKGKLVSLSEQNIIDCSLSLYYGNEGCLGGNMDSAFQYVIDENGVDTEASYPYQAVDGNCSYLLKNRGATVSSYVDIMSGSEDELLAAVASVGPVSVAIDASLRSFQFYKSGVYKPLFCSSSTLDHGVLTVGYGTQDQKWWSGGDYWIVKNSWGSTWGEDGYVRMARNHKNMCGIATMASYPVV